MKLAQGCHTKITRYIDCFYGSWWLKNKYRKPQNLAVECPTVGISHFARCNDRNG